MLQQNEIDLGSQATGKEKFRPKLKREIMNDEIIKSVNFIWYVL